MFLNILSLLFIILETYLIYKIAKIFSSFIDIDDKTNKKEQVKKRKHASIAKTDYSDQLGTRKANYDEFKNTNGLYEPITPTKGVKLDKKEAK